MDGSEVFDLDRSVARAWGAFRDRLADHLADMTDDDYLVLDTSDDEDISSTYAQFCAFGDGMLRSEVSSNTYLDNGHQLSIEDERLLASTGWNKPAPGRDDGSPNFWIDLPVGFADRAAAMVVLAFKDVVAVPHPTFLTARAWNDAGEIPFDVDGGSRVGHDEDRPLPAAIMPADRDELVALVDRVLGDGFGRPPVKDDDGDIPVRSGSALVYVRVVDDAPVVELFAPLVRNISNRTRAAEKMVDLNRRYRFGKFYLIDDYVMATISLPAAPFVPQHLTDMFTLFSELADEVDDQLASDLGGKLAFDDADDVAEAGEEAEGDDDALAPELQTLLELDVHGTGDLDPREVAGICGNDRDKVLTFIRTCSEQEIEWRQHAELALSQGDRDEAEACKHEGRAWAMTVENLRGALRVIVVGEPD